MMRQSFQKMLMKGKEGCLKECCFCLSRTPSMAVGPYTPMLVLRFWGEVSKELGDDK